MIEVKVKGIEKFIADTKGRAKQVRFAATVATNRVAFKARAETQAEMRRVFDRPTTWVLGGVRVKKATTAKPSAFVDFDFWGNKQGVSVEKVLSAQVSGGQRGMKRHELALQRVGILPAGMKIVPGDAATLDAYGNMSSAQINQIISWFKAFGEQGYQANMSDKRRASLGRDKKKSGQRGFAYFVLRKPHGKLLPGVYQRFTLGFGTAVKPVMIFVRSTRYKARFDFRGVVRRVIDDNIRREFSIALDEAMRTAR